MIELIVDFINLKLSLTKMFEKTFCLVEYINKGEQKYPAEYISKGNYESIDFDKHNGVSYVAKRGDVSFEKETTNKSADTFYNVTFPLKLVCFVNRDKLNSDNSYSDDSLATSIISQISSDYSVLRNSLKAKKISVKADSYITDKNTILNNEYDNIDFKVRFNYSYISIDLIIEATIASSCIGGDCDFDSNILHAFNFCDKGVLNNLTEAQKDCLINEFGEGGILEFVVKNSDNSFNATSSASPYTLPNETINIYVDGVLNTTGTYIPLSNETINITA